MKILILIFAMFCGEVLSAQVIVVRDTVHRYQVIQPQVPSVGIIRSQNIHVTIPRRQLIGVLAPPTAASATVSAPTPTSTPAPTTALTYLEAPTLRNTATVEKITPLVRETAGVCSSGVESQVEACYQKEINRYFTEYRYSGISEADYQAAQRRWARELDELYAENDELRARLNRLVLSESRQRLQVLPVPSTASTQTVLHAPVKRDTVYIREVVRDTVYLTRTQTQIVQAPAVTTVEQIERSILETGLFSSVQILFETGSAQLKPSSKAILDNLGAVLRKYPQLKFEIAGHTDSDGSEAFNLGLSQRRAEAVKQYLVGNFGIQEVHLQPKGYGESTPLVPNTTRGNKAQNRRVELKVLNPQDATTIRRN